MIRILVVLTAVLASCGGPSVVSVLPAGSTTRADRNLPLLVTVDATSARLPVPIAGSSFAYGDVDRDLARAIEAAVSPLSAELAAKNARHLSLAVDLVEARAEYVKGRVTVRLASRVTLRENSGNTYLAQTHAHASASMVVVPESGANVVRECTQAIAHQLSNWLSGMELR